MNSKDTRAALLVAKRATGGVVLGDQRQTNLSKFLEGNHPLVPPVLYHGSIPRSYSRTVYNKDNSFTEIPDEERTAESIRQNSSFKEFKLGDGTYGEGVYLSDSPEVASNFAKGLRADQTTEKPNGQVFKLHASMKVPFHDGVLKEPAWRDYIKDVYNKTQYGVVGNPWHRRGDPDMQASQSVILKKLDDGTATVRDLFLTDTKNGAVQNDDLGSKELIKTIKRSGYDGIISHRPDGSREFVVFRPEQVKSALGNNGQFDPKSKDITKATGGAVTDNDNFRSWFGDSVTHTNGTPHVFYTGTSKDKDFNSFNVGRHGSWFTQDPEVASQYADSNDSQGYKQDGWSVVKTNTASRVIPAYIKAEKPYTGELPTEALSDNYKNSQSAWFDKLRAQGYDSWIPASSGGKLAVVLKEPQQIKSLYNSGKFDPKQKHMNKATGGAITSEDPPEKIKGSDGIERFGFSFTPRAKRSIMKGQPAFARGGKVEPTDAQKSAGNYKKKHINFQGLPISIENEKGSIRSGQDEKGNKWSVKMPADYGYVKRTEGADGDHVDVYVGPDESSSNVFVIDQKDHRTGKFDEHKVMLGFDSLRSAIQSYTNGFSDGKAHLRLGNVARLSMKEFKQWLSHHDTKKPIRNQSAIDKALSVAKSAQGAKNGI